MPAFRPLLPLALASAGLAGGALGARPAAVGQPAGSTRAAGDAAIVGAHDPAWSPAGPRIALSIRDRIWTLGTDGRDPRVVVRWPGRAGAFERDPAWSPDGRRLAFAARLDDSFDLYIVDAGGGEPRRVTTLAGDERWPSWLPDGRLVFANRERGQWDLYTVDSTGPSPNLERLTDTTSDETEPRVSPDGRLVVFVSTADAADGEADLWLLELSGRVAVSAAGVARSDPTPLIRDRGAESSPAWAPDGARLAYAVTEDGAGFDPDRRGRSP